MTTEERLVFNGVDGDTGAYDLPPMSPAELVSVIRGEVKPENIAELRARTRQNRVAHYGVKEGVDPKDLAQAGWGVIFPAYADATPEQLKQIDAIREALQPLLQLRNKDTGGRFEEWVYGKGPGKRFRVGVDTKNSYLARQGIGPGPADPDKVPYYLLIVGSPSDIPYRVQSQLDVQYAVGRIHFETLQEYADYAASVFAAETSGKRLRRQACFFGVANPHDKVTQLSTSQLVAPLASRLQAEHADWDVQKIRSEYATKATLKSLLGGPQTPSLLFTASHGMKFGKDSPRQLPHQGALLCQDWPGPEEWGQAIPQDFYFAGDDLAADTDLLGLIAFFFACYGGGTPQFNEYARQDRSGAANPFREEIAARPFLAQLPTRMLGRPRGALAVAAHIERAWSYSFHWDKAGTQTVVFEGILKRLLEGHPLGSAMEYMNERYAELSTLLSDELEEIDFGKLYEPSYLAQLWTANNDARGYALLGDPAVRLLVARGDQHSVERSAIELQRSLVASAVESAAPQALSTGQEPLSADLMAEPGPVGGFTVVTASEVRTYVSAQLESPPVADLKIVTRHSPAGVSETVVHPDVAENGGLLALHQAVVERAAEQR